VHENNTRLMERRVGWSNRVFLLAASKQAGAFSFLFFLQRRAGGGASTRLVQAKSETEEIRREQETDGKGE
jgi:hypothetical protein